MAMTRRASRRTLESPVDEAVLRDLALPDIDWAEVPPGAQRSWFSAPSGYLATVSMGDRTHPRVVLVPGATGSKEDFVLMMPLLASAGYFVQSFDMAGQYESAEAGPPAGGRFDSALFVADLDAFLDAGQAPAHVLGYSFAGTVAIEVFARKPELFASLTLLSVPPVSGQVFGRVRVMGPFTYLASGPRAAALLIWGISKNFNKVPPGRLKFVLDRFQITSRQSVADILTLMKHTPDRSARLAASAIPKLVAVGDRDLWAGHRHEQFAGAIGAQLAVYRSGHSPCETAPHQLVRDMLSLFQRA